MMHTNLDALKQILTDARAEVAKVLIGQPRVVDLALIAIFSNQHALVEGVPGVGKTLLVRTLARVLGVEFGRIQFTPDLMPADITGTNVFNLQTHAWSFMPGPVFAGFLLADEINRAPAKTQSALLQAMQERRVTIDRVTHKLPDHFTVFATQNPVEYEGTYPLPEAQKDRFMLKIVMDYPTRDEESDLAQRTLGSAAPERVLESSELRPVLSEAVLRERRADLEQWSVRGELTHYAVDLVRATRAHDAVLVGAGPRASQALLLASRAAAALAGRDFITPDDIRDLAGPVLGHRLILRPEYEVEGLAVGEVVARVLESVPVPR